MSNSLFSSKDLDLVYRLAEKIHDRDGAFYFVGGYIRDKLLKI